MGGMLAARTKKRCTPDRLSLPQIYMRQRWYDPATQRFISRDPMGLESGPNYYLYCQNRPAQMVDPYGTDPWWTERKPAPKPKKKRKCWVYVVYRPVGLSCGTAYHTDVYLKCLDLITLKEEVTLYDFGPVGGSGGIGAIWNQATGLGGGGELGLRSREDPSFLLKQASSSLSNQFNEYAVPDGYDIKANFDRSAAEIEAAHIPYELYEHNSNAAADYLLRNAGLDTPATRPGVNVPRDPIYFGPFGPSR